MAFNRGQPYHGSDAVEGGKLSGKTGQTDYFFFLCPKCDDGQILRVLDLDFRKDFQSVDRKRRRGRSSISTLRFTCTVQSASLDLARIPKV